MNRPYLFAALLICGAFGAGCKCSGNTIVIDGGSGQGGGSTGGGSGQGGGATGGGGGDFDAGDGTITGGVGDGGFIIDGGEADGTGNGVKLDPNGNVVL